VSRSVSAELEATLATRGSVSLALCAEIRLLYEEGSPPEPATILGFTSWDSDITYDLGDGDLVYVAARGMSVSQVQGGSDGAVDHLEIKILTADAFINEEDIRAGKWNGASIRLFLLHPDDLTQGRLKLRRGTLGTVTIDQGLITAEFLGIIQHLSTTIGETVLATCSNTFAGAVDSRGRGCGLDLATYTTAAEVTDWEPDTLTLYSDDLDGFADDDFTDGYLIFDEQPWDRYGVLVFRQTEGGTKLKKQPPFAVTAGMTFTIVRGCAKTIEACTAYDNVVRFRGFPYLKGNDKLRLVGHKGDS
jgi:uncharacterized phage protein (TIGR02218 family)